jgi:hypothetical protein
MGNYFLYTLYNIILLAFILIVLLFLNTFINELFIPEFIHRSFSAEMTFRFLIATMEGWLFLWPVHLLNKSYFLKFTNSPKAVRTSTIVEMSLIALLCGVACFAIYRSSS